MNIKLNNEILELEFKNDQTIGEVLGAIELHCKEKKMTVTEVKADGKILSADELDDFFTKSTDENLNIELFTMSGDDIKNIIKDIGKKFLILADKLETIPIKMQSGEDEKVIKVMEEFSLNLKDLYTTVKFFDIADIREDYKFGDKTLKEYQKEISEKLEMLIEGLKNKDSVEVSDISEYELSPIAKELGNELLSI